MQTSRSLSWSSLLRSCRDGDLEELQCWHASGQLSEALLTDLEKSPMLVLVMYGHYDALQWLLTACLPVPTTRLLQLACRYAAIHNHLRILQWLCSRFNLVADFSCEQQYLLRAAADAGHLDVIRWIIRVQSAHAKLSGIETVTDLNVNDSEIMRTAALNGDLALVTYLLTEVSRPVDITARNNEALRNAIDCHFDEIVESLLFASGQLAELLSVADAPTLSQIPKQFQQRMHKAQTINTFLAVLRVPVAERNQYLLSVTCYAMIHSQLVTSRQELDHVLARSQHRDRDRL